MAEAATVHHVLSVAEAGRTDCPLCGHLMQPSAGRFGPNYRWCHSCQFLQAHPIPSEEALKAYYSDDYEVDAVGAKNTVELQGAADVTLLESNGARGKLLEVGCSWGFFLSLARSRGWSVSGVELSERSSTWAQEELGLDVFCGRVEDSPFADSGRFDAVVAWHVIEHVADPIAFLHVLRKCLKPRGLLALKTPNITSLPARVNGKVWQWTGAPAHLSLFSPKALAQAVRGAGFSVRHISTRRGNAYNPAFEVLRGAALRVGFHRHVKRTLRIERTRHPAGQPGHSNSRISERRARALDRLNGAFERAWFALRPLEKALDARGLGPELLLVAVRNDNSNLM